MSRALAREPDERPGWLGTLVGVLAFGLVFVPATRSAPSPAEPEEEVEEVPAEAPLLVVEVRSTSGPLAGARVVIDGREARTDAGGEARFVAVEQSRTLRVSMPGRARARREVTGAGREVVQLELASPVEGRVEDVAGRPLAGARVSGWALRDGVARDELPVETVADAEGRFVLDELPAGPVRVRAEHPGHAPGHASLDARSEVVLRLEPAGIVAGQVYDASGAAAGGSTIRLAGSGIWPALERRADPDGRFRWADVPPGIYELHAERGSGLAPPERGIEVAAGATVYVTLRMEEAATLRGVVTGRGEPVAGAEVTLTETGIALMPRTTTTDAQGRFSLATQAGTAQLAVRAAGFQTARLEVDAPGDVDIALEPAARIEGVVVDMRDRPVSGAVVRWLGAQRADPVTGGSPGGQLLVTTGPVPPIPLTPGAAPPVTEDAYADVGAQVVTGEDGRFVLEDLPPGPGQLMAERAELAPGLGVARTLEAGESIEEVVLQLPDGAHVEGRVVDQRGFPVAGVLVELRSEREPWPRTFVANDDGTFSQNGVLGVAVLTARPPEGASARERVEVASGEGVEIELVLPTELHHLGGRVFDDEGYPLAGAPVRLRSAQAATPFERVGFAEDDGTFFFGALPPPPWLLIVDDPRHLPLEREVEDGDELEIRLGRGGTLMGRVVDAWTRAPTAATLALEGTLETREVWTDENGDWRLERLPLGEYTLRIEAPARLPQEVSVTLDAALVQVDEVRLEPSGSIAGEVVDALGMPAAGAEVSVVGEDVRTETGEDGRFTLTRVPPGLVRLSIAHPAGTLESARIQVDAEAETRGLRFRLPRRVEVEAVAEAPEFRTGVAAEVVRRGEAVTISAVQGAAARSLRVGDVLISVEDEAVLAAAQARSMLRGPAGDTATLVVRRNGRELRRRVARERYLVP